MFHRASKQVWVPTGIISPVGALPLGVFLVLLSIAPAYAGKNYKISSYGGGHQIWFEAEDFDERNPPTDQYYPVVDQAGAFGKAISRAGGAGGMIRWTFDISAAGGKGGTWYFWARIISPNNQSDYMLVEGDPGDATIPTGPPFPGNDGTPPFDTATDRVFEETTTSWTWVRTGHEEGHTKVLQNGKNTMRIYHRQGDNTVFWDTFMWTDSASYVPTDDDYRNAKVLLPGTAGNPIPGAGATDVPRDAALSWEAGKFAAAHDVYFGTAFADVDAATRTAAKGVLASQGQTKTTFTPAGPLAYGQTYYWRIDEVNKTPDNNIFKGTVWSFTVEPYGYPIRPVAATASSAQANMGPEKTIDGSGLTGDLHGTDGTTMWLSTGAQPNWIQYQFDQAYKLHDLRVWNSNGEVESFVGFGAKAVTVETSTDGTTWTAVAKVPEFSQAPGTPGYAANTTVTLGDVDAKFVKLTINTNWGGKSAVTGLSEVRFSYAPMQARGPQPADNAGAVGIGAALDWRPGRDATSHKVFFGTDQAAVAAGTAPIKTVAEHGFDPGPLNFGSFYYWKVDEVGTASYPGSVWSFTTQPYQSVDDFESYNDDVNAKTTIYDTWIDGVTDGKSNSTVGNFQAPFAERTIVHGGKQAMPMDYNNTKTPFFSEAQREFSPLANWTGNGADTLSLWVRGNPPAYIDKGGNAFTVSGGGTDIWNNDDQFRFAYKSLSGDGSITAKVDSLIRSDAWSKAGVMIRETTDGGSKHAMIVVTPDNSVSFQYRNATSGASANTDQAGGLKAPYWVRLTRTGNVFKGESSPDGKTWTQVGTATITMVANVKVGLAVTSHNAAAISAADFSNVTSTGTGAWSVAAIGAAQPANSPGPLYVVVEDSAGKSAMAVNSNAGAVNLTAYTEWKIPLSSLTGVNLAKVKKLYIGVGDRASPKAGGAGKLYIDDIGFGKPIQWVAQPGEILIEAESATSISAPMVISGDVLASGGKYIGTPTTQADSSTNPPTTGIAQIPFTVPGGKYKLLFRVLIPGDNNSVWVRIADGTTQTKNHASGWVRFNDIAAGETWHWDEVHSSDDANQVVEWTLTPGAHTLEIAYREAGAQVDVIVIQSLN